MTVSIVVTDVKDFSDLTRQYPELMNKAMGIHNNILRKASHNHAGYIMDQEVRWAGVESAFMRSNAVSAWSVTLCRTAVAH